jgi:peptidoglycan/LPS O-acetylase OafA/YrhL
MGRTLYNLQALRGVACLLVVVFHVANLEARYGLGFSPLKPVRWVGFAGVDLFFVLSGFIIASTCRADLGRPRQLPRYLFRRAWRIYPAYWVAFAAAVGVYAALGPEPVFGPGWPAEMGEAVALVPRVPVCRYLAVSWTLGYELMFYAAFAVLFLAPRRLAVPLLLGWACAVSYAAAVGYAPLNRFAALAVNPLVLEFLAGALMAWWLPRLSGRQAAAVATAAVAWCAAGLWVTFDPDPQLLTFLTPHYMAVRAAVFGPAAALLVLAAAGWERAGGRLGWRALERVGDASYSVYLVHVPALIVTEYLAFQVNWPHDRLGHVAWLVLVTAAGVGAGLVLHTFVEQPLLDLVKRKKPAPAKAARDAPAPVRKAA